jgi:gamma-glutamylcyclotransferase (GGCT)/AIG2-like uncharacterized protein YtfP
MTQHHLYAYGTLQVPEVLELVIGRRVASRPGELEGYARYRLHNRVYPAIMERPGGRVTGLVYLGLDAREMECLDAYEGPLYERRTLTLRADGEQIEAITYVLGNEHRELMSKHPWDLEAFSRDHLADYLKLVPHGYEKLEPK